MDPSIRRRGIGALSEASWVLSARYRPSVLWLAGADGHRAGTGRLRELSHCRQLGSSWPGLQPRCSSIGRQGSPVPMREQSLGPLSPPRPVAPKTTNSLWAVGGAHSCMLNRSLQARRPPRPATQAILGLAPTRFKRVFGGVNLSLAAVLHSIAFWGVHWVRAIPG